jgi:hypothetical protein
MPSVNKILFLTGQSYACEAEINSVYDRALHAAFENGFACHIKDHPNPKNRLNITDPRATWLDPLMPAELLQDDYKYVVGMTSTALVTYGERSISMLELVDSISENDKERCKEHFRAICTELNINFVASLAEMEGMFRCE